MKINDLIGEFTIAMSNEEAIVLKKLDNPLPLHSFFPASSWRTEDVRLHRH